MKAGRIIAVIVGALLLLPALGLVVGGTALGVGYLAEREDDGYFDVTLERLSSATPAITTSELDLQADPGPPDWLLDSVDFSVRLRARSEGAEGVFIGIGPTAAVDGYLAGVARDEIRDIDSDRDVRYRTMPGTGAADPPVSQDFWVAAASGSETQELIWEVEEGEWTAVLMNADGSPGILAVVTAGVRSGALAAIAIAMAVIGAALLVLAIAIIVLATRGAAEEAGEEPAVVEEEPVLEPLRLEAELDTPLSPWLWLVKWFLAIPHFVVLFFLWIAFMVLTVIAGVAILFTGRYPRGMFNFNVGVLRWSWRVSYYAGTGGLGTDRYPPFTTDAVADYPADLDVVYPERLSRGLVLVKWWLLAIPHYIILGILFGTYYGTGSDRAETVGLLWILVLIAAVALLFTRRYPRGLYDLVVGLNRWVFRVVAYAALMTDRYPPFRLDQGGADERAIRPPGETGRAGS